MKEDFGTYYFKKIKIFLPQVKQNAAKIHIMEIVVSERYKVKQSNY